MLTIAPTETTCGVLFFNVWGPRHPGSLRRYLELHIDALDVVCLTEVTRYSGPEERPLVVHTSENRKEPPCYINGLNLIYTDEVSRRYKKVYGGVSSNWTCSKTCRTYHNVEFGSLLLINRSLRVIASGNHFISFDALPDKRRVIQWVVYEKGGVRYLVAHLHGVWIRGNTKGDHPARTEQSRMIRETLNGLVLKYQVERTVFGGDLNLGLETRALQDLLDGEGSEVQYRNLITEFGIPSTRTPEYRHFNWRNHSQHADYVLVCDATMVHRFTVNTNVLVSDHAPLLVTVS